MGRQILAYAQSENIPIHDIDLAHMKLTPTHWAELAARMGINVGELVNVQDPDFLQKFGQDHDFSNDDWLKLLTHNPEILKAPIVMKGDKIVAMNNPQDMLYFIEG